MKRVLLSLIVLLYMNALASKFIPMTSEPDEFEITPPIRKGPKIPPFVEVDEEYMYISGLDFYESSALVEIMDSRGEIIFKEDISEEMIKLPEMKSNVEYTLRISFGVNRWTGSFIY